MHRDPHAMQALRAQLHREHVATGQLFRFMTPGHDDLISLEDFEYGITSTGIKPLPTEREIKTLFDAFDIDRNRKISYRDFIRSIGFDAAAFEKNNSPIQVPPLAAPSSTNVSAQQRQLPQPATISAQEDAELKDIRNSLAAISKGISVAKDHKTKVLEATFNAMDSNSDGVVSREEFMNYQHQGPSPDSTIEGLRAHLASLDRVLQGDSNGRPTTASAVMRSTSRLATPTSATPKSKPKLSAKLTPSSTLSPVTLRRRLTELDNEMHALEHRGPGNIASENMGNA